MTGTFMDFLLCEAYHTRVNSKGERTKRKTCPPGFKLSPDGSHCIRITSAEHMHRAKGARRAAKSTRSKRTSINRKRLKAMQKRRSMGL